MKRLENCWRLISGRRVFADNGEDYGVNFISALSEIADSSGNIIDENGEVVASFKDLGDGVLDVAVDDFGKLAEALGTTEDLIRAVFEAAGIYSEGLSASSDDLLEYAQSLGAVSESAGFARINLETLINKMAESGASAGDIWDVVEAIQAADDISLQYPAGQLEDVISKAVSAQEEVGDLDEETATPTADLDSTPFDQKYQAIIRKMDALNNSTVVVNIKAREAAATGTSSAVGGKRW